MSLYPKLDEFQSKNNIGTSKPISSIPDPQIQQETGKPLYPSLNNFQNSNFTIPPLYHSHPQQNFIPQTQPNYIPQTQPSYIPQNYFPQQQPFDQPYNPPFYGNPPQSNFNNTPTSPLYENPSSSSFNANYSSGGWLGSSPPNPSSSQTRETNPSTSNYPPSLPQKPQSQPISQPQQNKQHVKPLKSKIPPPLPPKPHASNSVERSSQNTHLNINEQIQNSLSDLEVNSNNNLEEDDEQDQEEPEDEEGSEGEKVEKKEQRLIDRSCRQVQRNLERLGFCMKKGNRVGAEKAKERIEKEIPLLSQHQNNNPMIPVILARTAHYFQIYKTSFQELLKQMEEERAKQLQQVRNVIVGMKEDFERDSRTLNAEIAKHEADSKNNENE